jgi:hypothetical protein
MHPVDLPSIAWDHQYKPVMKVTIWPGGQRVSVNNTLPGQKMPYFLAI